MPPDTDEARRELIYSGALVALEGTPESKAFCDLAWDMNCEAFDPIDPNEAQDCPSSSSLRSSRGQLSAATGNCPETAICLPAGGHEICPLTVMGSARHEVVCINASRV